MIDADRALLHAIMTLEIDPPGVAFGFADRLARDNGWTRSHAAAVVFEYRRFLFLAATGDAPATPSDAVDQAWHLHLAYTRSYWDDLCGRVIGRALHHGPTEGGPAETARYREQYAATLARYAAVFGETPPSAIWPTPEARFGGRFIRVDRREALVFAGAALGRGAALAGTAVLLIAAAGEVNAPLSVLLIVVAVVLLVVALDRLNRRSHRRSQSDGCGGGEGGLDAGDGGDGCGGCGGD